MRYKYSRYTKQEDNWKELRHKVIKRGNSMCECCGASRIVDIHHLTYRGYSKELMTDLLGVCDICHSILHGWFRFSTDTTLVDSFVEIHGDDAPTKLGGFMYALAKVSRAQSLIKHNKRQDFDYIEEAEL